MLRLLTDHYLEIRSSFIYEVRRFFIKKNYLEIQTPLLNPGGNIEAFIDPFTVNRNSKRKSPEGSENNSIGYLITSPEYNLKSQFSHSKKNLFEIAHCFRQGDKGRLHTEEFLMLEWYRRDVQIENFIQETLELIHFLSEKRFSKENFKFSDIQVHSVESLFIKYTGSKLDYQSLYNCAEKKGYLQFSPSQPRYDELFFLLFLNEIEHHLGKNAPEALYRYPSELAALSKINGPYAERFEIYWKGIELANGYEELAGKKENILRFQKENQLRIMQNKNEIPFEEQFLENIDFLPQSCGCALGLDRLLMLLLKEERIDKVSPFI
ncbi:MAG: hypothetical protein OEZ34_08485 [Spirochaetia bacterium]|nr:hypothetical protein [Spirochaetia bacterium]